MSEPDSPMSPHDPLYETYYGLNEQPFAISTDPKFLFLSASHQRAYQELSTGLQRNEGLMLLTGEAGTGKTTLCRAVIDALGERTFSAILLNPYMTGAELLKVVLKEFGLVTREELRRGALARAEPPQLLDAIEGFLLSVRSIESRAVIVVDEAQSLSPVVLDQVRLLTALERHGKPLLQIIIGGQPKLIETLKKDVMYALSERITRRVHLAPLLADEVHAYVTHRLTVAGGADAVEFPPETTALIAELSRGLPRRVNLLCDRALQEGRFDQARLITAEMVRRAARSLAGTAPKVTDPMGDSIADGVPEVAATPRVTVATPPIASPAVPEDVRVEAETAATRDDDTTPEATYEDEPREVEIREPEPSDAEDHEIAAAVPGTPVAPRPDLGFDGDLEDEFDPRPTPEPVAEAAPPSSEPVLEPWDDAPNEAEPEPDEASTASAEALLQLRSDLADSASSESSSFSFGGDESVAGRAWLRIVAAVAAIALVGALAFGYYAVTVNGEDPGVPPAPAAGALAPAALTEARPVLDEATAAADLEQFRLLLLLNAAGGGGGGRP